MNLPPLNQQLYNQSPYASQTGTHSSYSYPPPHPNQPYFNLPQPQDHDFPHLSPVSSTLPTLDSPYLLPPQQSNPQCPQCKGQKYSFTAYFHNPLVFTTPPHDLLHWIERSYILKNRLQSLLVSYVLNDSDPEHHIQHIENEIDVWGMQVDSLAREAEALVHEVGGYGAGGPGGEMALNAIGEVQRWAKEMGRQLWGHVAGRMRLPMPKGRVKGLVLEFRKGWERVWVPLAEHRRLFSPRLGFAGY